MMKQFMMFVKKEFLHILRDPLTMLMLFGLPILMLMLFGFAITTEVKNTKIAVYDPSHDIATKEIVERLRTNSYFRLDQVLSSTNEIEKIFRENKAGLVIVFSPNFYSSMLHDGSAQIELIADGTDPNTATTLVNYATNIITTWQHEKFASQGASFNIVPQVKMLYNPEMKGAYNFVPGVMGMILLLICAMMTSISIAREKEKGTMEILLVSPMEPLLVIFSKVVPYFTLSCVNLTTVLLLSVFVLKVPIVGSLFVLVTFSMLYIFVALAIGILISTIVETQLVALLISGMALMIPVILLSGMMFPVESMPWFLRYPSCIVPARWYIIGVKNVMIKGLGFSSIIKEMVILGSMAIFLIMVSLKKFKNRLE